MDIFYLKKSEFLPNVSEISLKRFSDEREFKSKEKEIEHLLGIFLTKFIAKQVYDVKNLEIETRGGKPFFKSNEIFFSISHSEDIVMVVFNNSNIGVDVEYMKDGKNYKLIMKRYGIDAKNPSKKEFYRFWTVHEAEIKLNGHNRSLFSELLEENYMLACVSDNIFVANFLIKKLTCNGENVDLEEELKYPKFVKFNFVK